jgi:hypothetical protein
MPDIRPPLSRGGPVDYGADLSFDHRVRVRVSIEHVDGRGNNNTHIHARDGVDWEIRDGVICCRYALSNHS